MSDNTGVYVIMTPTGAERMEYRVVYLEEPYTIKLDLPQTEDPKLHTESKKKIDRVKVFTDKTRADEFAYNMADAMHGTLTPVFHVYISTPYPEWSITDYAKS